MPGFVNPLYEFGFLVVIMTELNVVPDFHLKKGSPGVEHSLSERQAMQISYYFPLTSIRYPVPKKSVCQSSGLLWT